jgi:hypothetical protein
MDSHIGLPRFDEPFGPQFHFEIFFGEPTLVEVRVILLAKANTMGEYLHPRIELETLGVYVCMHTTVYECISEGIDSHITNIRRAFWHSIPF